MPVLTLTTAGTRQAFVTPTAGADLPTEFACSRCTVELISGTNVYLGLQKPLGKANTVSSTVYDVVLNSTTPSFTISGDPERNTVYLPNVWWDSDTSTAKIAISPITV